jgi:adenylate kinase
MIPGKCDRCGADLILRDDDREETVRRRLEVFHTNNNDLIEHYRKKNLLRDVSAIDPAETIYANILKAAKQTTS